MRIAVLGLEGLRPEAMEAMHAIGLLAGIWRNAGHEVRFLSGCDEFWDADLAFLHVDLSVVPEKNLAFARRYPVVINSRLTDVRKSRISRNLFEPGYRGKVIVKTDLNAAGFPEFAASEGVVTQEAKDRHYGALGWPADAPKPYHVFNSFEDVPDRIRNLGGIVIEKFRPEIDGDLYRIRRSFILGDHAISYRLGDFQPIVEFGVPEAFEWIENVPEVLQRVRSMGLEYGTVDYTWNDGEYVILDINKTPGAGRPPNEKAQQDYDRILNHVSAGLASCQGGGTHFHRFFRRLSQCFSRQPD